MRRDTIIVQGFLLECFFFVQRLCSHLRMSWTEKNWKFNWWGGWNKNVLGGQISKKWSAWGGGSISDQRVHLSVAAELGSYPFFLSHLIGLFFFETDEKIYCRIHESIIPFYKVEFYQLDKSMNPFPTDFILFHMEHQSISFSEQSLFSFSSDFLTYRLNFSVLTLESSAIYLSSY